MKMAVVISLISLPVLYAFLCRTHKRLPELYQVPDNILLFLEPHPSLEVVVIYA